MLQTFNNAIIALILFNLLESLLELEKITLSLK